jgi:hypothetical protein
MLSREEMTARSIRLSGGKANRYTGTLNDPHSEAMSRYTGPAWAQHFGALQKVAEDAQAEGKSYRIGYGGFGNTVSDSLGHDSSIGGGSVPRRGQTSLGALRVMDDESARTNALNAYLGDMTDERRMEAERLRAATAHNDAIDRAASDQSAIDRAMAIANTPGVSQFGRPIVGGNGTYQTLAPTGDEPPVNRQAIAAQMAPGKIAPPVAAPVTFAAPVKAIVNGKSTFVRPGSDGMTYDMARRPIDPAALQPEGAAKEDYTLDGVRYSGATNQPIAGTPKSAAGPALSATQRDELAVMDTVQSMNGKMLKLGEKLKWEGTGGMGYGSAANFIAKNFGVGSPEAQELRSYIGNIKGTIAKLRGGTAFSANEEKLLDTYTPGIDDSPMVIKSKTKLLNDFIDSKRTATKGSAGVTAGAGGPVVVKAPDGSEHPFETQAQADDFKKRAGIQ